MSTRAIILALLLLALLVYGMVQFAYLYTGEAAATTSDINVTSN